jgi:catechol 2,3-dioxygenase-like lactoylglutathione lyase family enzyme
MIRGLNHVGISVANLDRSVGFYRDLLGMEVVFHGEFAGEQYETILALEGARGRVALLKSGNLQIELFEFSHPVPKRGDPRRPACDHGLTHFCIEVADIEGEYERLKAVGVPFHCPPLDFFGAEKATYGRDPDGNLFELLQMSSTDRKTKGL